METLRHWALLLCSGCILYGLLENLLPRRGVYPVIKTVAVLYILLILLSPARSVDALLGQEVAPAPPVEVSDASMDGFWQKTAQDLQQRLQQALTAAGLDAQLLNVRLQTDGGSLQQVQLYLRRGTAEDQAVRQLCDSLLGFAAAYEWEEDPS